MKVLIVDDELPAIEGTLSALDWEHLGVGEIFTALSSEAAKTVFLDHPVDIIICDIEMPRENGIDLLRWVRENHPETEAILLTAHADFKYAQQAVQLGCVDYVLKPVEPSRLEQVVNQAVSLVNRQRETLQYRKYGEFWLRNQPFIVERFWLDILNGAILPNVEAIHSAAAERLAAYNDHNLALPVLIKIQRWYRSLDLREESAAQTLLRDDAESTIKKHFPLTTVIPVERDLLVSISELPAQNYDAASLKIGLETLVNHCNQVFLCDVSLYVGSPAAVVDLNIQMRKLRAIDQNNVSYPNRVFLPQLHSTAAQKVNLPDFTLWSKLVAEGLKEPLHKEVDRYRQFLHAQNGVDEQFLIQFHQDFLQMIHSVLLLKGIQAHQLFNDRQSQELSLRATRMVPDLFTWVAFVIDTSCNFISEVESTDSVMDKVRRYVAHHIQEPLSREEIANFVFLNPDYLTRIVKKETGLPLTEYIQQQRIWLSKDLLLKSDLPVSEIAMQVGYTHFSQFSKIFKKHVDMTPIQFRKKHKPEA